MLLFQVYVGSALHVWLCFMCLVLLFIRTSHNTGYLFLLKRLPLPISRPTDRSKEKHMSYTNTSVISKDPTIPHRHILVEPRKKTPQLGYETKQEPRMYAILFECVSLNRKTENSASFVLTETRTMLSVDQFLDRWAWVTLAHAGTQADSLYSCHRVHLSRFRVSISSPLFREAYQPIRSCQLALVEICS